MTKRFTSSSLLIWQLKFISQEHVLRLMKDNNSKFPSKCHSEKSLQVCSSMLPLFSYKIKIHNIHQRQIKNLLLKTNNKRNTTIDNSIKKVMDIVIRCWIATILFLSHTALGWIARWGLESLKEKCVKQTKALDW